MDSRDDRVLVPLPLNGQDSMMNEIQPQNFMSNLDDPAAALLTYFINENDGGAAIMPVPSAGSSNLLQQQPYSQQQQDHEYTHSRISDQVLTGGGVSQSQHFIQSSRNSHHHNLPHINSSQPIQRSDARLTQHQQQLNQTYDLQPTPVTSSNFSNSVLSSNTISNSEPSKMMFGHSHHHSDLTQITTTGSSQLIDKQQQHQPIYTSNINPHIPFSSHANVTSLHSNDLKLNSIGTNSQASTNAPILTNVLQAKTFDCTSSSTIANSVNASHVQAGKHEEQPGRHHYATASSSCSKLPPYLPDNSQTTQPTGMAEVRTVITLKIVDQIVLNGEVVKETVKEEQFVRPGGKVQWPEGSPSRPAPTQFHRYQNQESGSSHAAPSKAVAIDIGQPVPAPTNRTLNFNKVSVPSDKVNGGHKLGSAGGGKVSAGKQVKRQKAVSESIASGKGKTQKLEEVDSETARREMASALLSLQMDRGLTTPTKNEVTVAVSTGNSTSKETTEELKCTDVSNLRFIPVTVGHHVMAKWVDKNFYPGKVVLNQGEQRWAIVFDDGGRRTIHESEIISVPHLCVGQFVMVSFAEGFCLRGVIKRPFYEKGNLYYIVEYNDSRSKKDVAEKFSKKDIFLTHELGIALLGKQVKETPENVSKFADVDLNNIIPKRSRQTISQAKVVDKSEDTSTDEGEVTAAPVSQRHKNKKVKIVSSTDQISPPDVDNSSNSSRTGPATPAYNIFDEAVYSLVDSDERLKGTPSPELETLIGPLPKDSLLFDGIAFLLTSSDSSHVDMGDGCSSAAGRSSAPFDIPYLTKQIVHGGGKVFDSLEEAQDSPSTDILLIAYTYLRTVKYMQCLAAGIQCVMHMWIVDSCRENTLLKKDKYLLPSGYSIISSTLPSDKSVFKRSANIFKGMRIMLISKNNRFQELWWPVLRSANAILVEEMPASPGTSTRKASNAVDLIVSDATCPVSIVKKAKQMKIPVVSCEYVAQCLINGKKLSYDVHEKFKHNSK